MGSLAGSPSRWALVLDRIPRPGTRITLSVRATAILGGGALLAALQRGLDYVIVIPPESSSALLSLVERVLALSTWGWIFVGLSLLGAVATWFGRYRLLAVAHGTLMGVYLAFGIGSLADVLQRDPIYGWRTGLGWLLTGVVVHAVLANAAMREARRES